MENRKKRIAIALDGSTLGNTLPEQMKAVKITAKAIVNPIEESCEAIVAHGNGPRVSMINNAMAALSREDASRPNIPFSVYVAVSQAHIGHDLQNVLREEFYNREVHDIPIATMITQVRVDTDNPVFEAPSESIGHFMTGEQARIAEDKYDHTMKEDSERGFHRVMASPKPTEIVGTGAIRSLVDSGQLVITCGGDDIPVICQGNHLKGAGTVIDKDFASELLTENLSVNFLTTLTVIEKVAINLGKPEGKRLGDLDIGGARQYIKEGHFVLGSMSPKVQAVIKFAGPKPGRIVLITLLGKAKDGIRGKTGIHIYLA